MPCPKGLTQCYYWDGEHCHLALDWCDEVKAEDDSSDPGQCAEEQRQ